MRHLFICGVIFFWAVACKQDNKTTSEPVITADEIDSKQDSVLVAEQKTDYHKLFEDRSNYNSDGFDFPVGKPNARGYYNAQKFQENNHLGDDWNGVGGGNTDLGDPIYSLANGYISEVKDYEGGWGNIVRIVHLHNNKLYESLYAHCDTILVSENQFVKKGEQIATIGNCNGNYLAHLHLELRDSVGLSIGPGYSSDTTGYLDPTDFINKNRN
ncbi:M23 family metallopeptidase [Psychroserpens luteolus]|uniref:M23 family metallopeptidase n=1 Tax=Psychroserpens luteolus TaxID=2855840 RepID=UPI001E5F77AA|nr:M23 family metallopeptidase [Psychroserpens luteolus]MCD2259253.1 M23 family metallopeptidase [Psychroserpens luteolus]